MKLVYLLFCLMLVFNSCTKFGKNVTIKGRVLNPITGQGIENVEFELLRTTTGLPGGYKSVKSTHSESDGSFEISKGGLSDYWLACRVPAEYYQIGWMQNGSNVTSSTGNLVVKKGKTMHADFYAVPYGLLSLDIENVNCENEFDTMQFRRKYQFNSDYDSYWSSYRNGCYSYVSPSPSKIQTGFHYFETKVTRSGVTNFFYDTVFVTANGISVIQIKY